MPKRTSAASVAAAAVLLLALTGCAGGAETPSADRTAPGVTATASPTESPEPLVATTPTDDAPATPETAFLDGVRAALDEKTQIPNATDEQLLDAGQRACQQLAEGGDVTTVRVIEGETPDNLGYYGDSTKIASIAQQTLCAG